MVGPRMYKISQQLSGPILADLPERIRMEFGKVQPSLAIKAGAPIAVAVGSRGIGNLPLIVKGVVEEVRRMGGAPFIVPAMGSHGGGTAEGQRKTLERLGITEQTVGAVIKSAMDPVEVGRIFGDVPILVDRHVVEAGSVIPIARIKSHTDFAGTIESGILKMLMIGLGKQRGADLYHRVFMEKGHETVIVEGAREIVRKGLVLCGVGVVENGRDETSIICVLLPNEIEAKERELLIAAKSMMARLPFSVVDILIIDEMGKEISGAGLDPNVTGRSVVRGGKSLREPEVCRVYVRSLTEASHGNASGIGAADFVRQSLLDQVDREATALNCITGCTPEEARLPIAFKTDREALEACFATIRAVPPHLAKVVHILNTLRLETLYASEALLPEVKTNRNVLTDVTGSPFQFTADGNLISPFNRG
jgi:hypothetical protein